MDFKKRYDNEFEAHIKTKEKYLKEAKENLELIKKNDELERKLWNYMDEVKDEINGLMEDYQKLFKKAMDNDETDRVNQFNGSLIALDCLKRALNIEDDEYDMSDEEYENDIVNDCFMD